MSVINEDQRSPFLKTRSFAEKELEQHQVPIGESFWQETASPFQSFYELETSEEPITPLAEEMATLLNELQDREFDYAVAGLVDEAAELFEANFVETESDFIPINTAAAERMLMEHFAPLSAEIDQFLDEFALQFGHMQPEQVNEIDIDRFTEQYAPAVNFSTPQMDFFWGSISKAAKSLKKAAKKAANVARKGVKAVASLGIKQLTRRMKRPIKLLIGKVIGQIIGRVPRKLRKRLRKLKGRFLKKELEGESDVADDLLEEVNLLDFQGEFDIQLAQLVMAESETEQDLFMSEMAIERDGLEATAGEANRAREQFIRQIPQLEEGEHPGPMVEQFVTGLLPIVKLGVRLIGEKRVQKLMIAITSTAIRQFVGKKYTPLVAKLIVKAGWKALNLETSELDGERAAAEAVASIVEEVVRETAAFPRHVLENDELLESFVMESFEKAVASYMPPMLSETIYEERPELRETTEQVEGFWLALPRRRGKLFYKYTLEPQISISPLAAEEVRTWHGTPLSMFLHDRFRIPRGRTIKARIHLYQAGPRTLLSRISKHEAGVAGLGSSSRSVWSQIHPLTPKAASILLGQPRMARKVPARNLIDPLQIGVGQRFYYLELMEVPAAVNAAYGLQGGAERCCQIHYTLDFVRNQIRSQIFLSEAEAQKCAVKIRQQVPAGAIAANLKKIYDCGLRSSSVAGLYHRAKVVHGGLIVPGDSRLALQWLPAIIQRQLAEQMSMWLDRAIYQEIQQNPLDFVKATEDEALGLTIAASFNNPAGFAPLGKYLAGVPISLRDLHVSGLMPEAAVQYIPGNWHG